MRAVLACCLGCTTRRRGAAVWIPSISAMRIECSRERAGAREFKPQQDIVGVETYTDANRSITYPYNNPSQQWPTQRPKSISTPSLTVFSRVSRLRWLVVASQQSLTPVRGNRPGKAVTLQEYEIKYLCTRAREIFISQPILLELEAPIKICGKRIALRSRCSS